MNRTHPNWLQFEHETRQLVEAFGYRAETTTPSHDYGVDVIARNDRRDVVIQCKLYGKGRIGGDTMMKMLGSRAYFKATDAICITTSRFTKQAQEIAAKEDIKLIDREMLLLLCRERYLTIPSLTVITHATGGDFSATAAETTLGRDVSNNVVVPLFNASRRHAILRRDGLRLYLADLGSTNGTFLNERKITHTEAIRYGDQISIASALLTVTMQTPSGIGKSKA